MAISLLELRHIIESGFLPLECRCTSPSANELTIEIIDRTTGANFVVGGIDVATLATSRAISDLIGKLRTECGGISRSGSQYATKTA
jgi:antitoxin component of RelBE/YafQ-DinJ toxin-antitoxin module